MTEVIVKCGDNGAGKEVYHQWFSCPHVSRMNNPRKAPLEVLPHDISPCRVCIPNGEVDEGAREYKAECDDCSWFTVTDELNAAKAQNVAHTERNLGHGTDYHWRPKNPEDMEMRPYQGNQDGREQPCSIDDPKEQRAIALLDGAGWSRDELGLVMKASETAIETAIDRGKEVDIDL